MAGFAKSLPILSVPEKFLVSPVWNDVIDHRCFHIASSSKAPNTQRMGLEINSSGFSPAAPISFFCCGLCIMTMEGLVFLAVHRTVGNQPPTAGVLAWGIRSAWHSKHALSRSSQLHGQCHESLQPHLQPESGP